MTLDRNSVIPLYHQIKEQLRDKILSGAFHSGERIPSEHELSARYGVSRNTAKQAIA
ncbi:MAG TPA: GntR family transcriptional regulator, partial [Bacteroidetes bacterium]|nr:GntR family transcriptional regulator [Bacteroidota bacterium]